MPVSAPIELVADCALSPLREKTAIATASNWSEFLLALVLWRRYLPTAPLQSSTSSSPSLRLSSPVQSTMHTGASCRARSFPDCFPATERTHTDNVYTHSYVFAGCVLAGAVIVYFFLYESAGLSLENVSCFLSLLPTRSTATDFLRLLCRSTACTTTRSASRGTRPSGCPW